LLLFNAWTIDALYTDPCRHVLGPVVGRSVEDLVNAFRGVPALGAGDATDVEVGGLPARHLTLRLDPALDAASCASAEFQMWAWHGETIRYVPPGIPAVEDELWILEVAGSRIVLDASLSERAPADDELLETMVRSIGFPDA
jgi:hypothetical protein